MSAHGTGERGDWSYVASFVFALSLLAAVSLAIDAEAVAYARAQLWVAVTAAARAGARCLAPAPQPPASATADACVQGIATSLVSENLAATSLTPVTVTATAEDSSVEVSVTADLAMPLGLPGAGSPLALSDAATAALVPEGS